MPVALRCYALIVLFFTCGNSAAPNIPLRFFSEDAVVWLHCNQVLPFQLLAPAIGDVELPFQVSHGELLEVLRPPTVLSGEQLGFVRVRGLREGETTLTVAGTALRIEIRCGNRSAQLKRLRPRLVAPVPGAYAWGDFSVGVELWDDPVERRADPRELYLRLPDGRKLAPTSEVDLSRGPVRRLRFDVPGDTLPEGPIELVAVALQADGSEMMSDPLLVRVLHSQTDAEFRGECEEVESRERPRRFGKNLPRVLKKEDASGGWMVQNYGPNPAWCLPVEIQVAGEYQLLMRVGSHFGGGAFPTIAIYVDEANQPTTSSRLVAESWHQLPIGRPIHLEAGPHLLTPYFYNDFYAPRLSDRNLFLDSYEIRRVSPRDGVTSRPQSRPAKSVVAMV
ncbi:MAG: hypothetical protein V3T77_06420, partial [Planctomycetota bacterium]